MKISKEDFDKIPKEQLNGIYEVGKHQIVYWSVETVELICINIYWYLNGKHHRLDGPAIENIILLKKSFIKSLICIIMDYRIIYENIFE